jgi:hypothetical protein
MRSGGVHRRARQRSGRWLLDPFGLLHGVEHVRVRAPGKDEINGEPEIEASTDSAGSRFQRRSLPGFGEFPV